MDATGPIIGANVLVKGTTNGTVTDMNGNFVLDVKKGDVIQVSFIGYLLKNSNIMESLPSMYPCRKIPRN